MTIDPGTMLVVDDDSMNRIVLARLTFFMPFP